MTERRVTTKVELLAEIERTWTALNTTLAHLTEVQMTIPRDAQGWAVKDHLIHLMAWERGVVFFLQGQPRHDGLGVDEAIYLNGTDDEINAVIQQQRQVLPLTEVLAQFHRTHQQLLQLLQPLTDLDLQKLYRHYLPDEPGEGDGPPAIDVVNGNSARHFAEHLAWIEALVNKASG